VNPFWFAAETTQFQKMENGTEKSFSVSFQEIVGGVINKLINIPEQ
jgi:hypothetical protein